MHDPDEKLALHIEARKERDEREAATWYNNEINSISANQRETEERLGSMSHNIKIDFDRKREIAHQRYQEQRQINENTYYLLQNDLAAGNLHHVWIDAKEEQKFNEAKVIWDRQVTDKLQHYGKALTDDEIYKFEEKYGFAIVQQLRKATAREFKQQLENEQKMKAEREERARQYQAEQALEAERARIKKKEHEAHMNGRSATFDTYPVPRQPKLKPSELLKLHYQENKQTMDGGESM